MFDAFPWLILILVLALLWWQAMGAKARARAAALKACEEAEVTFIDELAFKSIALGRDAHGQPCVKRRYGFEFYRRGDRRYGGEIEMHAQRLAAVHLDPYPVA